jgi:hypothetical protein
MNGHELLAASRDLGRSERIWLAHALWDDVGAWSDFTPAQLEEIEDRLEHYQAHPEQSRPLADVLRDGRDRLQRRRA